MRRPARGGIRSVVVIVAGALAALVLVGQGAFGAKISQTEVSGTAVGFGTVYGPVIVNGDDHSLNAKAAEGEAAATIIEVFGQCASAPRLVSHKKPVAVVQVTGKPCSTGSGGLGCNSTGGNGSTEGSTPPKICGTTTTTIGEGIG